MAATCNHCLVPHMRRRTLPPPLPPCALCRQLNPTSADSDALPSSSGPSRDLLLFLAIWPAAGTCLQGPVRFASSAMQCCADCWWQAVTSHGGTHPTAPAACSWTSARSLAPGRGWGRGARTDQTTVHAATPHDPVGLPDKATRTLGLITGTRRILCGWRSVVSRSRGRYKPQSFKVGYFTHKAPFGQGHWAGSLRPWAGWKVPTQGSRNSPPGVLRHATYVR